MAAYEIPDDIAAVLRDRATGVPATKPLHRDRRAPPGASRITALAFAAGIAGGIAGALTVLLLAPLRGTPVPIPVTAVAPAPAIAAVPAAPEVPLAPRPRVFARKPSPPARAIDRATERAWLDAARAALAQQDFDGATRNLESARARFPEGALREEREALAIHVLVARGERDLAEMAIHTFHERHPMSPFALAIEEAMAEREANR